jgi:hypothetical protein
VDNRHKAEWKVRTITQLAAMLLNDYFEGAGNGSGGANSFALKTPITFGRLDYSHTLLSQHQGVSGTDADAQPTPIKFVTIDYGQFNHTIPPHPLFYIILS